MTTVEITFRDTSGPVAWDADLWVVIAARGAGTARD